MTEPFVTLAKKYDPDKHDVMGWGVSEKLDGVRAIYNPEQKRFVSRTNKPLNVPPEFLAYFKDVTMRLDGEFFAGRGQFQTCVSLVRRKNPVMADFKSVQFVVFDCIVKGSHQDRLHVALAQMIGIPYESGYVLRHFTVTDMEVIRELYAATLKRGGEGLMFRNQAAGYEFKRTGNLLKWKPAIDGTALVTGVIEGEGKHEGRAGALVCLDDDTGVVFHVGTGLSDEEREWWWEWSGRFPFSGKTASIRWRAMERTRDNVPRHPVYVCIHKGD